MTYLTSVGSGVDDAGATTYDSDAITISGTNKVLYVMAFSSDGSPNVPSGVVLDPTGVNEALTKIDEVLHGTFGYASIWRLIAPSNVTSKIVRVTWGASQSERGAVCWAETGLDQTTPNDSITKTTGTTSTAISSGAVTTTPGDRVLNFAHAIDTGTFGGAGQFTAPSGTERIDGAISGIIYDIFAAQEQTASGASTNPSWTLASDGTGWASFAFKLTPAGGPAGPTVDTHPKNQNTYPGEVATFTVAATTSGGTLNYQWKFNGSNVGTNSTTYTRTTVIGDELGLVTCEVTDDNGTTASNSALLRVFEEVQGALFIVGDDIDHSFVGSVAAVGGDEYSAGGGPTVIAVAQLLETDALLAVAGSKRRSAVQLLESDSVLTVARLKRKSVAQLLEADSAQTATAFKRKEVAQLSEVDSIIPVVVGGTTIIAVNQLIESDAVQPVTRVKVRAVNQLTESSAVLGAQEVKSRTVAQLTESGSILHAIRNPLYIQVVQLTESDTLIHATVVGGGGSGPVTVLPPVIKLKRLSIRN